MESDFKSYRHSGFSYYLRIISEGAEMKKLYSKGIVKCNLEIFLKSEVCGWDWGVVLIVSAISLLFLV